MDADERSGESLSQSEEDRVSEAVRGIIENRASIEQTKGMLMFVYGIDAEAAFDVLRWQSQHHNIKLRLLAEQGSKDLMALCQSTGLDRRLACDGVLLTAHQRIVHVAERQRDGESKTEA